VLNAQAFTQRGFLETRGFFFPQSVRGDSSHAIGEALLRYEASYQAKPWMRFSGAFDARTDSHRQTEREWSVSWLDRTIQRPAFAVRRLEMILNRNGWNLDIGRQLIRWGKTDILNPTDRFAPRDYMSVVDNDFLAVSAARVTVESGNQTWDAVYVPRLTPSRTPLLNQRWAGLPEDLPEQVEIRDAGARYPGGGQVGFRWSRTGSRIESSLCFYEGFNHLPLIQTTVSQPVPPRVDALRIYPKLRLYGGDLVIPTPWFLLKSEAAYFSSPQKGTADEYVLYVVQLERLAGEWVFVAGYAGEAITTRVSPTDFAPDRGLTRAFLMRTGYTIDTNRSVAVEAAIRQNGDGVWIRGEYSQLLGSHWRMTGGLTWIHGDPSDFLGRYRRNSHATLTFRYSF
jgi:hypothetical protein